MEYISLKLKSNKHTTRHRLRREAKKKKITSPRPYEQKVEQRNKNFA